ncbi:MAG: hypothetical protein BWK79_08725 [Beggiatoa sp. IS2]|nr:MAG: hypothetical protein BWK79_08725 [Beggiatoa sp. IS2]
MAQSRPISPIYDSYWVRPQQFLAGRYPNVWNDGSLQVKLRQLLQVGITFFADLTEERESGLEPYDKVLHEEARHLRKVVTYQRLPIQDFGVPTVKSMRQTLDALDDALARKQVIYVHCYAGIGRTGTVVGCYLVRHGLSGEAALQELADLRQGSYLENRDSPITPAQRQMVIDWPVGN